MVCVVGGGGKMGSAIVAGLLAADPGREIVIVVREGSDSTELSSRFPSVRVTSRVEPSDGVILSVKPKDALEAAQMASSAGAKRLLSVAAGITLDALQAAAGPNVAVIRSMPNLGAQLRKSATGYCAAPSVSDADIAWAESLLQPVGIAVRVDEPQMDAVTGVSGSGIAFILLVLEALIDAGQAEGLSPADSRRLAIATLDGAAAVAMGGESPAQVRARITTPNGTTAAGLAVMEDLGVRRMFKDAVAAAAARSREMGRS